MPNFFPCETLEEAQYMFQEDLEIWPENTVLEWTDPESLMVCMMRRSDLKHWCGYVSVTSEVLAAHNITDEMLQNIAMDLSKEDHGGLTFQNKDRETSEYIFGFDCAHIYDFVPGVVPVRPMSSNKISEQKSISNPKTVYQVWVKSGVDREVTHMAQRLWSLIKVYGSS